MLTAFEVPGAIGVALESDVPPAAGAVLGSDAGFASDMPAESQAHCEQCHQSQAMHMQAGLLFGHSAHAAPGCVLCHKQDNRGHMPRHMSRDKRTPGVMHGM